MPRIAILGCLAAAGIVGWLYWQQRRPVPLVVSGFIEADEVRVGSRVGGRIAEVTAQEGRHVSPGDILYRLDPFDLQHLLAEAQAKRNAATAERDRLRAGYRAEEIEQARARRDRARAVLDRLVAGPRTAEVDVARADLERARAVLEWAQVEYDRLAALQQRDEAAPVELNAALRTLRTSRAEAAAAEQRLALMLEGSRSEDIAEARAAVADAEQALSLVLAGFRVEDVAKAEAQAVAAEAVVDSILVRLAETTVTSPCECVVEAIDLQPGDLVAANAPSVALLDTSNLWVRTYVPEAHLSHAQLEKPVSLTVASFPKETFAGRVTFVSRDAEFTPRNVQTPEERAKQVFRIKVAIESGRDKLRVGMSADVRLAEAPRR